jgi:hypothetical protein
MDITSNPPNDGLWQAQALWQISTAGFIASLATNDDPSIFVDNLESRINQHVLQEVASGSFPHLNLLTMDFVCNHGPEILAAIRHGVPQPLSCLDGLENGDETDVDCGGGTCPACVLGRACAQNTDCIIGNCELLACAPFVPTADPTASPTAGPTATSTSAATSLHFSGALMALIVALFNAFLRVL